MESHEVNEGKSRMPTRQAGTLRFMRKWHELFTFTTDQKASKICHLFTLCHVEIGITSVRYVEIFHSETSENKTKVTLYMGLGA